MNLSNESAGAVLATKLLLLVVTKVLSSPDLSLIPLSLVEVNLSESLAESAGVVAEYIGVVG